MLVMDPEGVERVRLEGYLPRSEFRPWLEMSLARVDFIHKRFSGAEAKYASIVERYAGSESAPEAVYWRGVSHYKQTSDHTVLGEVAEELKGRYPDSIWATKAFVWLH